MVSQVLAAPFHTSKSTARRAMDPSEKLNWVLHPKWHQGPEVSTLSYLIKPLPSQPTVMKDNTYMQKYIYVCNTYMQICMYVCMYVCMHACM